MKKDKLKNFILPIMEESGRFELLRRHQDKYVFEDLVLGNEVVVRKDTSLEDLLSFIIRTFCEEARERGKAEAKSEIRKALGF